MKVGENMRIPEPVLNEDFYMVKRIGGNVTLPSPKTRFEELLYIYAGGTIERPTPKTVEERFLDYITGGDSELPVPKTRLQSYMYNVANPLNKIPVVSPKTRFECYWYVMSKVNNVISDDFPVEFTSVDGFLLDYTIWGNSEQDGKPTPEKHIEVQSVGDKSVNLFDINGDKYLTYEACYVQGDKFIITSLGAGATSRIYWSKVYPAGTYFITAKFAGSVSDVRFYSPIQYSNGSYNSYYQGWFRIINNGITVTFTQDFTVGFIVNGTTRDSGIVYDIQIQKGSTGTDFEPYGKYKIPVKVSGENDEESTTNIYLDETLRKIGDYADYIEYHNQRIVRRIGTHIYTGEESFVITSRNTPRVTIGFELPNADINASTIDIYSTHFKVDGSNEYQNYNYITTRRAYNGRTNWVFVPADFFSDLETNTILTEWRIYLQNFYRNGNPIIVYYVTDTTEKTPVEIPKIQTYAPKTELSVDTEVQPSKIEVVTRTE